MGEKRVEVHFSLHLSEDDIRKMQGGLLPEDMDSKWVGFLLSESLEFYRSWTCKQIYHLPFNNGILGPLYIVDDPTIYRPMDSDQDIETVNRLIDWMRNPE